VYRALVNPLDRSVSRHVALLTDATQLTTIGGRPRYSLAFIDDGTIQSITGADTLVTIPTTGTTASTNLVVEDTGTASVATVLTLSHVLSSGTPAAGIGAGMTYYAQVTGGPIALGSTTIYATNVGVGTVSSVFSVRTRIAGTLGNRLTVDAVGDVISEGRLALRNGTAFSTTLTATPTADRVLTLPDADDTVVTLAESQVLSNKSLGSDLAGGGFSITGLRLPVAPAEVATKQYVDAAGAGLQPKGNARVQAQVDVNIAAPGANIDGVAMVLNDVVALFTHQVTGTETGLWVWNGAAVPLTRTTNMAAGSSAKGAYFYVTDGTDAGFSLLCTNAALSDVVGTDTLVVSEFTIAPSDGPAATPSLRTLGTTSTSAAAGNDARLLANGEMGAVCVVDQVLGSDVTGARSGLPFQTITAALAATTTAGDCVWIMPGVYNESITIPANVAVRGINTRSVTIQKLLVTADTTLVTMGEGSRLEDVNMILTSAEHHTLVGILWPGTTTATAKLRTSVLTVDNSTAGALGTSNVYGYHASGTGTVAETTSAVRASAVTVRSAGLGDKRAVLVSGATEMNHRDIALFVTNAGGAGSYIGAETTNAGSVLRMRVASVIGPTADISQTAGRIELGTVTLSSNNANGLGFDVRLNVNVTPLIYADSGATPSGTRYMRPGTATVSATPFFVRIPSGAVIRSITVHAATGPGAARTDTWTVQIDGADTIVATSLTGAAVLSTNESVSAGSAVAFDLSVKQVCAASSTTSDVAVVVGLY